MRLDFLHKTLKKGTEDRIKALEECYRTADDVRRSREPEWFTNISMLAGRHWESFASDILRFRRIPIRPPQSKARVTSNLILTLVRQAQAALESDISRLEAVPNTGDPEDVAAAELASMFLEWRFYEDREQELLSKELLWAMCTGRVLRYTWWNPDAGRPDMVGPNGSEGDINTTSVNVFRFLQCPWAESADWPPPWVVLTDVRDVGWVKDRYGVDVEPETVSEARRSLDKLLFSVVEDRDVSAGPVRKNGVVVKKMFVAPTISQPSGWVFVWANKKMLYDGPLPEDFFPLVPYDWFYVPGMQYPLPMVTPLVPLQRELNIILSQLIELKNRQLRGDVVVQGDIEPTVTEDSTTGRRTIHVPYNTDWQFVRYDLNTTDAKLMAVEIWNYMMQVAGVRESTLGQTPPRASTATQVQLLRESDLAGLLPFKRHLDWTCIDIARQKLQLAQKYYNNERVLRVVGADNEVRSRSFFGADLKSTYDIRARTTPLLPTSAIAQLKMEAASRNLYGPYEGYEDEFAKRTALLAMRIPGVEDETRDLMPMSELRRKVGDVRRMKGEIEMASYKLSLAQIQAQLAEMYTQMGPVTPELEELEQQIMNSPEVAGETAQIQTPPDR